MYGQSTRRGTLGDLPLSRKYEDRQGPINDPGSFLFPEWINEYQTAIFAGTIGLASARIIPANPIRSYLLVQNKDAASDLFINFGNSADSFNGIIIIPRGNYEFIGGATGGPFCPSDSVHLAGAAANMNYAIVEGSLPPTENRR